jgi:hypothetical protein
MTLTLGVMTSRFGVMTPEFFISDCKSTLNYGKQAGRRGVKDSALDNSFHRNYFRMPLPDSLKLVIAIKATKKGKMGSLYLTSAP